MPSGGRRPGQGRPKGSLNKRSMEIARDAAERGVTPLEVMLENMQFAREKLPALLQEIIKDQPLPEKFNLMAELQKYRVFAQEAAKDAAPYMHPRLANVAHSGPDGGPVQYEDVTVRLVRAETPK
jgi:hypothetical protein